MLHGRMDRIGFLLGVIYTSLPLIIIFGLYSLLNYLSATSVPVESTGSAEELFEAGNGSMAAYNTIIYIIGIPLAVASVVYSVAISVRRWHDANLTGWLTVLLLLPYVGFVVLFVQLLLPGTKGKNKFGEPRSPRSIKHVLLGTSKK